MMRRRERGTAFIIALAVVLVLTATLVAVAEQQRENFRARRNEIDRRNAQLAAEAGVQFALAQLSDQFVSAEPADGGDGAASLAGAVTLNDAWASVGQNASERFIVGGGAFRVQILDGSAFLNINAANEEQLRRRPLTDEQIESLLDWREGGLDPRPLGAKDNYYNGLPNPYNARLGPFQTVDELLLVKGWNAPTLYEPNDNVSSSGTIVPGREGASPILYDFLTAYSYSQNQNSEGEARVNVNAQATNAQRLQQPPISLPFGLAQQIAARKNWSGVGEILDLPQAQNADIRRSILDNLTSSAQQNLLGRINLNTADESVLSSIPEFTTDIVQSILQRQTQGFASLGELADIPGMEGPVLRNSADLFTVSSTTFRIRVIGESGSIRVPLEATVDLFQGRLRTVSIATPPYDDMRIRWNWPETANFDTTLVEAQ